MKKEFFKIAFQLMFFSCIVMSSGCTEEPKTHSISDSKAENAPVKTPDKITPEESENQSTDPVIQGRRAMPEKHECNIAGTILEDNSFWIKSEQTLVGISADSTTKDIDFGESHRVFTVMNSADCKVILKETLPINRSPDFPWYLNTNTYESINQVMCMQGIEFVYCYDAIQKKMLPQMKPKFLNKRVALDAQSGTPAGLEIWDRYLVGYALDLGASVFDLSNKDKPKVILPVAEVYSENDESYHSLFLLVDRKGEVQALMPTLNEDQDGMIANLLFKETRMLNTVIKDSEKNNRFVILTSKDAKRKTAIDLEKMTSVDLPAELLTKNAKAIMTWLKKNSQ